MNWTKMEKCKCGKFPLVIPKGKKRAFICECGETTETAKEWNEKNKPKEMGTKDGENASKSGLLR